jgi:hypothetical protein
MRLSSGGADGVERFAGGIRQFAIIHHDIGASSR